MGKPLRLLNLTLGLIAFLIAGVLAKTWVAPTASRPSPAGAKPSQEPVTVAFNRPARPPLAQFDALLEINPFKQPPPMPVKPQRPGPPSPPPLPLPTLVGTISVDNERRAVLSDKGKGDIYSLGQEVAGGTLTEISDDLVLFKRGDTTSELMLKAPMLKAPIQSGAAPHLPTPETPPPAPAPASSSVGPSPPARATEGAPALEDLLKRRGGREQRRLLELQQKYGQGLLPSIPKTGE